VENLETWLASCSLNENAFNISQAIRSRWSVKLAETHSQILDEEGLRWEGIKVPLRSPAGEYLHK